MQSQDHSFTATVDCSVLTLEKFIVMRASSQGSIDDIRILVASNRFITFQDLQARMATRVGCNSNGSKYHKKANCKAGEHKNRYSVTSSDTRHFACAMSFLV